MIFLLLRRLCHLEGEAHRAKERERSNLEMKKRAAKMKSDNQPLACNLRGTRSEIDLNHRAEQGNHGE